MATHKRTLNIFMLTMINLATILSIRNWPVNAEFGFASIFMLALAMLLFFIPVSFVAAELASGWPELGGIFVWVKEAMGHKMGFLAVWLLWLENVVYYPLLLSFIAGTLAYVFDPDLASNKIYAFWVITLVFWITSLANLMGMKFSGWVSSVGVILGTLLPGIFIIVLGFIWYTSGQTIQISMGIRDLVPDLTNPTQLAFLTGILLGFGGMEMPAVHALDVKNPQKNYPRAIFLSALIIIVLSILGTLAVAIIIPKENINFLSGTIEAVAYVLNLYKMNWLIPIVSILVAIGALGGLSTWIVGPAKGLLAAAGDGDFPPFFHKVNRHEMPITMLIAQAIIVTIISSVFLFLPTVSSSFWILTALASQLYLIMYALMFISAIVLRYKKPEVKRDYKVPGGTFGMWFIAGIGTLASIFSVVIGFFPPAELKFGSIVFYETFLGLGIVISCIFPFIILWFKKESWNEALKLPKEATK